MKEGKRGCGRNRLPKMGSGCIDGGEARATRKEERKARVERERRLKSEMSSPRRTADVRSVARQQVEQQRPEAGDEHEQRNLKRARQAVDLREEQEQSDHSANVERITALSDVRAYECTDQQHGGEPYEP